MTQYNPKDWLKMMFRIAKSETIYKLIWPMVFIFVYSLIITFLELHVLHWSHISFLKDLTLIHTMLGFVLTLLLVFRTNSAYDRWWEGRKLWGKLVNDCRNLAIKLNAIIPEDERHSRMFFKKAIAYFPHVLSEHLTRESTRLSLDLQYSETFKFSKTEHAPVKIVNKMMFHLQQLYNEGKITGEQMIFIDTQLSGFLDVCGGCERIKNTPIPFSYSVFIKKFIITYVMILPLAMATTVGYAIIFLTAFIFYILMSLEIIAEEIEDPFGNDDNDLPTETMAQNIEKLVEKIIYTK